MSMKDTDILVPEMPWITRGEAIKRYESQVKHLQERIKELKDEINLLRGQRTFDKVS